MLSSRVVVGATFGVLEALLLAMAAAMQVRDDEATQSTNNWRSVNRNLASLCNRHVCKRHAYTNVLCNRHGAPRSIP